MITFSVIITGCLLLITGFVMAIYAICNKLLQIVSLTHAALFHKGSVPIGNNYLPVEEQKNEFYDTHISLADDRSLWLREQQNLQRQAENTDILTEVV